MNIVSTIGKALTNVFMEEYNPGRRVGQSKGEEEVIQPNRTGSSFQDIFSLIDTNTDSSLSVEEMEKMNHLMNEFLVMSKDGDGDGVLTAEEAGMTEEMFAEIDANQDGKVDVEELNKLSDEMLAGIIKVLDKNGDNALSLKEMALLSFIFGPDDSTETEDQEPPKTRAETAEAVRLDGRKKA